MARPNVRLNRSAVKDLLKSAEVQRDLKARADRIAAAAGDGFESSVQVGRSRARASVIASTYEARRAEAQTGALSRALGAGR